MDLMADDAVAATNDDASLCKFQAVTRGYYKDKYLDQFLPVKMKNSSTRKAPEINRGYFARSASIAYLAEQFIKRNPFCQIISLGAGYDSLYWRLRSHDFSFQNQDARFKYVEIDMSTVVVHKIMAIRKHPELMKILSEVKYKGEGLHSNDYHLISFDLRQTLKESLRQKLKDDCGVDFSKPTLCLAECVLVYMPMQDSDSLIKWLAKSFTNLSMVNYEQCNMNDRFGEIMLANMNERHCDLMGVEACQSLDTQSIRFKANNLVETKAWTMAQIYKDLILPAEIERIETIEFLDERELLDQLLEHYCIVVGSNQDLDWIQEDDYWLAKSL